MITVQLVYPQLQNLTEELEEESNEKASQIRNEGHRFLCPGGTTVELVQSKSGQKCSLCHLVAKSEMFSCKCHTDLLICLNCIVKH